MGSPIGTDSLTDERYTRADSAGGLRRRCRICNRERAREYGRRQREVFVA